MPSLASQVNEATIVRAGLDPASVSPAEVYAAKLVLGGGILLAGITLSAVVAGPLPGRFFQPRSRATSSRPSISLPNAQRQAELLRELPDFLAWFDRSPRSPVWSTPVAEVSDAAP